MKPIRRLLFACFLNSSTFSVVGTLMANPMFHIRQSIIEEFNTLSLTTKKAGSEVDRRN